MPEREKVCILCGKKEVMVGYICMACQDRIQKEAVEERRQMLQEASGNIIGGDSDEGHKT